MYFYFFAKITLIDDSVGNRCDREFIQGTGTRMDIIQNGCEIQTVGRYKNLRLMEEIVYDRILKLYVFNALFQYSIISWRWHKPGTIT